MKAQTRGVVVGYDGTAESDTALGWAAEQAQRRALPLTLLHVVDDVNAVGRLLGATAWPHRLEREGMKIVEQGARLARAKAPLIDLTTTTEVGRASGTLIAASSAAVMLVVGTRVHRELIGAATGSVAFAVSAQANCPCVVVRGEAPDQPGPGHPVIVGIDGSSGSDAALRYAAQLAAETDAPLQLVAAYQPAASRLTAERFMSKAVDEIRQAYPNLEVGHQVLYGPPVSVLTDAARGAAMLVLGSRGYGGFVGLMLGSVCQGAISAAPCPVAVLHETRTARIRMRPAEEVPGRVETGTKSAAPPAR